MKYIMDRYHCSEGSTSPAPYGDEAPVGAYSNPSSVLTLCPLGSFGRDSGGQSAEEACELCEPSYYCPLLGTTVKTRQLCPRGFFCEQGSAFPSACPAGKVGTTPGASSVAACSACALYRALITRHGASKTFRRASTGPAGFYCQAEASERTESFCVEGHFCPANTSSWRQYPCPAGTFSSQTGLHDAEQCKSCPMGSYCPEGSTAPTACSIGTYNARPDARTSTACQSCEAGWSCPTPGIWSMSEPCMPGRSYGRLNVGIRRRSCPQAIFARRELFIQISIHVRRELFQT